MGLRSRLAEIYARLPRVACRGLCAEACGPIVCTAGEALLMLRASGRDLTVSEGTLRCGYLSPENRCEVYAARPFVCRAYGASAKLPCGFGCRPIDPPMAEETAHRLFEAVLAIGGQVVISRRVGP